MTLAVDDGGQVAGYVIRYIVAPRWSVFATSRWRQAAG